MPEDRGLSFIDDLIRKAESAARTGEAQSPGMFYGATVVLYPPERAPPLRYAERFSVQFDAMGNIR